MNKRAFVFPGQGSQEIGMGRSMAEAFPDAREVFEEVDDALGQKLYLLMTEGPVEELNLTANTQPAIMAASLAVVRVLKQAGFDLSHHGMFAAGHSLGEYTALAACNALSLSDAARLLRQRGEAMQRAMPVGVGAMAALLGVDFETASSIAADAAQGEVCEVANDNAPGQVVISGHKAAIDRAIAIGAGRGARKSVLLPVSAPFHCSLMQPAADEMQAVLEAVRFAPLNLPVIANVTAGPVENADAIAPLLVQQITSTVRWRESVLAMRAGGVEQQVEIGNGKVLTGLAKRIDKDMEAISIATPEDIDAFIKVI